MTSLKAESVIRGMIQRIGITCLEQKIDAPSSVISALVKGALLDPQMGINLDDALSMENVDTIVEKCVADLSSNEVSVQSVKAQVVFAETFKSAAEIDSRRKKDLEHVMRDIEDEIFSAKCHTREEFEALYRQIVSNILLRNNMGAPTDITVVKETTAALESVLPPEELGTFIKLPRASKKEQLRELGLIVMGIRLFNRGCDKGGQSIPPLNLELEDVMSTSSSFLDEKISFLKSTSIAYASTSLQDNADASVKEELLALAAHAFQLINFFLVVETQVSNLVAVFVKTRQQLSQRQERLLATINNEQAVSTDQVFPQFIELGELWQTLQAIVAAMGTYGEILSELGEYCSLHETLPASVQDVELNKQVTNSFDIFLLPFNNSISRSESLLNSVAIPPEQKIQPLERPTHQSDFPKMDASLQLLEALKTHNFSLIPLQFAGICPFTLVTRSTIVPARRDLGVLQRGNVFYGAFTREGSIEFASNPAWYLQEVVNMGRHQYELVGLLSLHPFLSHSALITSGNINVAVKCDSGSQTELHPIAENINKKYEWNEWELRRKALKLANLRKKKTHSTQTHKSQYRRDNDTQVYLPKDRTTQTKQDSYTNTSKPVTYIRGLRGPRGPKTTPHQVVDLTLAVGGLAIEPQKANVLPRSMHKGGKAGRKYNDA
eukprot:m.43056 g.43056  ORF g.43056 m.43056 type:complete len:665 (+) comp7087_c0_seq3:130-2124(+)